MLQEEAGPAVWMESLPPCGCPSVGSSLPSPPWHYVMKAGDTAKFLTAIAHGPLLSMLRFSQLQSSCLAVCSMPHHPAAGGTPSLPPVKPALVEPASLQGPLFSCLGLSAHFQGQSHSSNALCTHTNTHTHTWALPPMASHAYSAFLPCPLPAAVCLPAVSSCCGCMPAGSLPSPSCSCFILSLSLSDTHVSLPQPHFWAPSRIPPSDAQLCPPPICFLACCPPSSAPQWHRDSELIPRRIAGG